jgi:precorrin-2/cobalt-factor-2 C20-methyltransferase
LDKNNKKLFMVSLGPGDIDLLTIKALDVLKNSDVICVPTKSKDSFEKSLTKKIIDKLFKKHNFTKKVVAVYTPMHFKKEDWQYQVDILLQQLKIYDNVSFVTLGDAAVYSTVYYLLDIIKMQEPIIYENSEVIAGVTSFSNASAIVKKPLCVGDSAFSIVPLLNKTVPNTTIYMRPKIGFDTTNIDQQGDIYTFENLNYDGENITKGKVSKVSKYMTLFIDFFK